MISWGLRITQNGDWHNNFLEELRYFAVRKKQKKTGLGGNVSGDTSIQVFYTSARTGGETKMSVFIYQKQ